MAKTALHNDDWLFDSSCFVCEQSNEQGLRIPFFFDDDTDEVSAVFTLGGDYSGAPQFIHGGISLAVLDEAQGWATIASAGKFAVTAKTSATFRRPVEVGKEYTVVARVHTVDGNALGTSAEIVDGAGVVCVRSEAEFVVISAAVALQAVGGDLGDGMDGYLAEDG